MYLVGQNYNIDPKKVNNQNFRGGTISVPKPSEVSLKPSLQKDSVEILGKKKKKLSKNAKRAIIIGSTIAVAVLALKFGPRIAAVHNVKKKLPIRNLPEKLDFTEAKTLEEARKYAIETLQIKDVDNNLSLEALNLINKGLTDVSNAQKGKVVMPTALKLSSLKDANAAVVSSLNTKDLGEMLLNDKLFSLDDFEKFAKDNLKMSDGRDVFYKNSQGKYCSRYVHNKFFKENFDDAMTKLLDKFYTNPELLTKSEKLTLKLTLSEVLSRETVNISTEQPRILLAKFKDEFKKRGVDYNLSDFNGKSDADIIKFIEEKISPVVDGSGNYIKIDCSINEQYRTIYHEMGHIQDINKNYGVITKKIDLLKLLKTKLLPSTNHFAKRTDEEIKELLKTEKGRKLLQKEAPLTYEFITDKNIQDVASEVSSYATTGIGEFIAETYEHMISGKPISERVKSLYKKYNGPLVP